MDITTWLSIFIPLLFGVVITMIGSKIKGNIEVKKLKLEQLYAEEQALIESYSNVCCAANHFFSLHTSFAPTNKLGDSVGKFKALAPEVFRSVLIDLESAIRNIDHTAIRKYLLELDNQWISYRFGKKKPTNRSRRTKE